MKYKLLPYLCYRGLNMEQLVLHPELTDSKAHELHPFTFMLQNALQSFIFAAGDTVALRVKLETGQKSLGKKKGRAVYF